MGRSEDSAECRHGRFAAVGAMPPVAFNRSLVLVPPAIAAYHLPISLTGWAFAIVLGLLCWAVIFTTIF